MTRCDVELPGIGPCEVEGEHAKDGIGRDVHRHGACSWNGGPVIEVDEKALDEVAKGSSYA